jgi:hypothetical protein
MPHGHGLALGLYVIAWVIVFRFGRDVVVGGTGAPVWGRALHQSF